MAGKTNENVGGETTWEKFKSVSITVIALGFIAFVIFQSCTAEHKSATYTDDGMEEDPFPERNTKAGRM